MWENLDCQGFISNCCFIEKCPLRGLPVFKTKPIQHSVQSKHGLQAQDTQKRWELIFYKIYLVCIKEITAHFFIAKDEEMEDVVGT